MKLNFKPKTRLEQFGYKIYNLLVENFPRTYLVGGTARDFLLDKKITDIDIATEATPKKVSETLKKYLIKCNSAYADLGVIIATEDGFTAAIATFRKDFYKGSRYPKIKFTTSAETDAQRRDFTVNSLYFSPKTGKILDFFGGLNDLKNKKIRFVGNIEKKIKQDPLRIIRALRFALMLNFKLDKNAKLVIKKHLYLVKQITKTRMEKEILKLKSNSQKNIITMSLKNKKMLDKYF